MKFWSSGGLIHEIETEEQPEKYDLINVFPKHINVISLVPGKAVVAFRPKGYSNVSNYTIRVTHLFVEECGGWKVGTVKWSLAQSGSGKSQTLME